ncbi:MAG TPA: zinc-dependent metalloprotease [Draconibacterium sp.]|nr:zinc-dependent metalloprotease [Draconibacterium sp.]
MKKIVCFLFIQFFLLTILTKVTVGKEFTGFFNFSYSEKEDKIILEVDKLNVEFLYVSSLASGVGSNDLGLDRGRLSGTKVVKFVKAGNKLLLVQPNYDYRASSENKDEVKAVDDAFATSVLWGFKIEKEENGKIYIDATDFFLQDAANVIETLKQGKEGIYKIDKSRSALYLPGIKSFPKNSEFEAVITFTGESTGRFVRTVTPTASSITVHQHHSFIELPDDKYKPRVFDPRAGYFSTSYMDYATPFDQPITKRFINRHRLVKKNPNAKISEAVNPIIYYVDRGTPEPIKSALIEGASWWNQAFEAAGFKNAFIVKEMPEGADMLDVRYNTIQWVHRSTRGWSYGSAITDPRTGEILKGHVSLGSLRIRQDFMIAQGLISPYGKDKNEVEKAKEMALARIRQLAAHEVGHTLGLAHAYSSSGENRGSVMDYPQPLVKIKNGKLDFSDAYDDKIGEWDKIAIDYGYREFSNEEKEKEGLQKIIQDYIKEGRTFLSDRTSAGGVQPYTSQWDNGKNPYEELKRMMEIRKIALNNFGENTIPEGTPFATLEDVLVPVYYYHRYQITAAAKMIGGLDYRFALKGDGQLVTKMISPEDQENALQVLLRTITPEELKIPEKLLQLIPPKPMGYNRSSTENIKSNTGLTFDPLSAAEALANMVFGELTNPQRAQRLIEYHGRDSNQPGLDKVLGEMISATWGTPVESGYSGEIQKVVDNALLLNLEQLALNENATPEVKALTWQKIQKIATVANEKNQSVSDAELKAHYDYAIHQIEIFNTNPEKLKPIKLEMPPQGAPIGMD